MSHATETPHDTHLYDPTKHDNQIIAVFEDRSAAERARDALVQGGTSSQTIKIIDEPATTPDETPDATVGDQILGAFMGLFSADHDHDYAHAVQRGHAMLVVTPEPGADRHLIVQAIEQAAPIDFDAKLQEWRQAGYSGDGAPAATPAAPERRRGQPDAAASTARVRSYIADRT